MICFKGMEKVKERRFKEKGVLKEWKRTGIFFRFWYGLKKDWI